MMIDLSTIEYSSGWLRKQMSSYFADGAVFHLDVEPGGLFVIPRPGKELETGLFVQFPENFFQRGILLADGDLLRRRARAYLEESC